MKKTILLSIMLVISFSIEKVNAQVPSNDDCANSIVIPSLPYNNSQDATQATDNNGPIMACPYGMNDGVWYRLNVNNAGGDITVEVTPQGWNPEVAVYTGTCNNLTCVTNVNNAGGNATETLTFTPTSGAVYFINVGHWAGTYDASEGPFTINVTGNATLGLKGFGSLDFVLFPNPSTEVISWNANGNVEKIQITNLTGQVVMEVENPINNSLNIAKLNQGIYLLHVFMDGKEGTYKLIKE